MTTPIIPDFIFTLFQNEVATIVNKVLDDVSKEFQIDRKSLHRKIRIDVVPESQEKIKIMRIKARTLPDVKERCMARVKDIEHGGYTQCKARHLPDCEMCKRHTNKPPRYGRIDVDQPAEDTTTTKVRRIRKIY